MTYVHQIFKWFYGAMGHKVRYVLRQVCAQRGQKIELKDYSSFMADS